MLEPSEGLLTFRAEGNNIPGSKLYTRVIHFPGKESTCLNNRSGVTIGRGYDLGGRSKGEIVNALTSAGIPREQAEKIAAGAGLKGCAATEFVRKNKNEIGEITESQQLTLFNRVYRDYLKDAIRFYNQYKNPGAVSWEKMDYRLRDVFVDMKYQGNLFVETVRFFEKNDISNVVELINKRPLLKKYEDGRHRVRFLMGGR